MPTPLRWTLWYQARKDLCAAKKTQVKKLSCESPSMTSAYKHDAIAVGSPSYLKKMGVVTSLPLSHHRGLFRRMPPPSFGLSLGLFAINGFIEYQQFSVSSQRKPSYK